VSEGGPRLPRPIAAETVPGEEHLDALGQPQWRFSAANENFGLEYMTWAGAAWLNPPKFGGATSPIYG
jgi:hypothetical protein